MGHWKKSRSMKLINRGLEIHVTEDWLRATESWRVTRIERMVGGTPSTTYDRIMADPESSEEFRRLCREAIDQDFEMPDHANGKVFDLRDADGEE